MARRKDLAGLATLAGLAYMASRDKGEESGKGPAAAMDAMTSGEYGGPTAAEPEAVDYGNEGRREGPMAVGKVAPSATARPRTTATRPMGGSGRGGQGGATAEELAAYAASKAKPKYQSLQDRARAFEEERAASGAPGMYGTRKSVRREALPTAEDMAYKKGGSVKGWGTARGARKAKIY